MSTELKTIPWAPETISLETVPCPVCGRTDFQFMLKAENVLLEMQKFVRKGYKPYPLDAKESNIVRCRRCALVQVNPRRKQEDLFGLNNALHLVKNYKDGDVLSGEILPGPGDREMRLDRVRRVMAFKKSGRWLDVGCGSGRDLDIAIEHGFEGYGVELSEVKKDFYTNKKFKAFVGPLEKAPFAKASFDVISMWDVLEHVEDPNSTLATIRELLKPGGIFVGKVPNYGALSRRVNGRWWDMYHPLHLYYFTVQTLGRLMQRHGMEIVHTYSLNPYGFGTLVKDIKKHAQKDPRRNYAALAAASAEARKKAGVRPKKGLKTLAVGLFKWLDRLPKWLSLQQRAGTFIAVYAQKK